MNIQSVAVFCGSQRGINPVFTEHTAELGILLARMGIRLVYGGGKKGLMGTIADSVLANGGAVLGIIPEVLTEWEQQHLGLTELLVVPDMHTRKKLIYEKSDAAIVLPGGFGTLDEMFEMLTWNQLKIHDKKIFLLNSGGYFDHLVAFLLQAQAENFLYETLSERILLCQDPGELYNRLRDLA